MVKVAGPRQVGPPFFQARTGHEWVLTLRFLVRRNAFQADVLARQLALAPFHEAGARSSATPSGSPWASPGGRSRRSSITAHAADELATDAFDAFLVKAAVSYQKALKIEPNPDAELAADLAESPGWKVVTPENFDPKPRPNLAKLKKRAKAK